VSAGPVREPESTPDTLYVRSDLVARTTLGDILAQARRHFGTENDADLTIVSENVQIRGFGHDQYDGADWRQYVVITKD
jgi:hypothetical protein